LSRSFLISGVNWAIRYIERSCLSVSGSSSERMSTVSAMIARPHPNPTWSWKTLRIASKTLISG